MCAAQRLIDWIKLNTILQSFYNFQASLYHKANACSRVARWYICISKIQFWNGQCWYTEGHLVQFVLIWNMLPVLVCYTSKSDIHDLLLFFLQPADTSTYIHMYFWGCVYKVLQRCTYTCRQQQMRLDLPWRHGEVVLISAIGSQSRGFESRQSAIF
jgi:hypothetical protein